MILSCSMVAKEEIKEENEACYMVGNHDVIVLKLQQ